MTLCDQAEAPMRGCRPTRSIHNQRHNSLIADCGNATLERRFSKLRATAHDAAPCVNALLAVVMLALCEFCVSRHRGLLLIREPLIKIAPKSRRFSARTPLR